MGCRSTKEKPRRAPPQAAPAATAPPSLSRAASPAREAQDASGVARGAGHEEQRRASLKGMEEGESGGERAPHASRTDASASPPPPQGSGELGSDVVGDSKKAVGCHVRPEGTEADAEGNERITEKQDEAERSRSPAGDDGACAADVSDPLTPSAEASLPLPLSANELADSCLSVVSEATVALLPESAYASTVPPSRLAPRPPAVAKHDDNVSSHEESVACVPSHHVADGVDRGEVFADAAASPFGLTTVQPALVSLDSSFCNSDADDATAQRAGDAGDVMIISLREKEVDSGRRRRHQPPPQRVNSLEAYDDVFCKDQQQGLRRTLLVTADSPNLGNEDSLSLLAPRGSQESGDRESEESVPLADNAHLANRNTSFSSTPPRQSSLLHEIFSANKSSSADDHSRSPSFLMCNPPAPQQQPSAHRYAKPPLSARTPRSTCDSGISTSVAPPAAAAAVVMGGSDENKSNAEIFHAMTSTPPIKSILKTNSSNSNSSSSGYGNSNHPTTIASDFLYRKQPHSTHTLAGPSAALLSPSTSGCFFPDASSRSPERAGGAELLRHPQQGNSTNTLTSVAASGTSSLLSPPRQEFVQRLPTSPSPPAPLVTPLPTARATTTAATAQVGLGEEEELAGAGSSGLARRALHVDVHAQHSNRPASPLPMSSPSRGYASAEDSSVLPWMSWAQMAASDKSASGCRQGSLHGNIGSGHHSTAHRPQPQPQQQQWLLSPSPPPPCVSDEPPPDIQIVCAAAAPSLLQKKVRIVVA